MNPRRTARNTANRWWLIGAPVAGVGLTSALYAGAAWLVLRDGSPAGSGLLLAGTALGAALLIAGTALVGNRIDRAIRARPDRSSTGRPCALEPVDAPRDAST